MQIVNMYEAKTQLSKLVDLANTGKEVVIGRAGKPVARLVGFSKSGGMRNFGVLKGKIEVSDDFDAEDKEIEEMFYGKS